MPTKIAWKPFYSSLPPPALRGPGGFEPHQLPVLKKNRIKAAGPGESAAVVTEKNEEKVDDDEVEYWFKIMQARARRMRPRPRARLRSRLRHVRHARMLARPHVRPHTCARRTRFIGGAPRADGTRVPRHRPLTADVSPRYSRGAMAVPAFDGAQEKMTTRFAELRRAFRTLDEDASGNLECVPSALPRPGAPWLTLASPCTLPRPPPNPFRVASRGSREEFKQVLVMFNLGIPPPVMEKLIDLADFDGDGSINFAEFARIFTAENVLNMKKTLSAVEGGAHAAKVRYEASQGGKGKLDKETGENVRLRRTGPGLEKMRKAHRTLRNIILTRYGNMKAAFKDIDADGSGMIRRAELRKWLATISKSIPDQVISGLISYVDTDGDTKTLSREEFLRMMSEEFLDDL